MTDNELVLVLLASAFAFYGFPVAYYMFARGLQVSTLLDCESGGGTRMTAPHSGHLYRGVAVRKCCACHLFIVR